tara:strand:- start:2084 stop:3139 length:1056 start_codon:yes stop_codon:yes gene_type:complete
MTNNIKFTKAINIALTEILSSNKKSSCIGLGINDPKRIFNTTENLLEKFGDKRIIEPPTSENALTGIGFGMALRGYSVCLIHQRFDFSLLSFDQIINTMSKWKFMFGKSEKNICFLIRLIVGRGWGQGPTHSQSYHSFLSSIPEIQVLYPYDSNTAYQSVLSGMYSGIPTLLIEHRWLHNSEGKIENKKFISEWSTKTICLREGHSCTMFAYGYMVPEAIKACKILEERDIKVALFTTTNLSNIKLKKIEESLSKTNNLTLVECFTSKCSITNDIALKLLSKEDLRSNLKSFEILSIENGHESTSYFKNGKRYKNYLDIVNTILKQLNFNPIDFKTLDFHDIPGTWFTGPF